MSAQANRPQAPKVNHPDILTHVDWMARERPQQVALCSERQSLTWQQVQQHVNALAHWLMGEGQMRPKDRVGLYHVDNFSFFIVLFACWRARLIPVNLGVMLKPDVLTHRLQESGCRMLVINERSMLDQQLSLLRSSIRKVVMTRHDDFERAMPRLARRLLPRHWWSRLRQERILFDHHDLRDTLRRQPDAPFEPVPAEQIGLLHYSNGLSNEPRAVTYTYAVIMSVLEQASQHYAPWIVSGQKHLCCATLCMGLPLRFGMLVLYRGGTLLFAPTAHLLQKPAQTLAGVVAMTGYPAFYQQLLLQGLSQTDTQDVQLFFCGGAKMPATLQHDWHARMGRYLHSVYGVSETGFMVAGHTPAHVNPHTDGRFLPGVAHQLCDPLTQQPVQGNIGELWLKSRLKMDGYWHNRGAMETHVNAQGWVRTHDLVRVDNQQLTVLCRCTDLLWRGQCMILPQEIEEVAERFAGVAAAAAVQNQQVLHARIHLFVEGTKDLDLNALGNWLLEGLPPHQVPDHIQRVERLPRSLAQEVSRRMVRMCFLHDGAPAGARASSRVSSGPASSGPASLGRGDVA